MNPKQAQLLKDLGVQISNLQAAVTFGEALATEAQSDNCADALALVNAGVTQLQAQIVALQTYVAAATEVANIPAS